MSVDLSLLKCVQIVSKLILSPVGTTQLRCIQPAKYLNNLGLKVITGRLDRSIPKKRSIIIIHRALLDRYTEKFIKYAKLRGSVVVYDTDDLLFDSGSEKYISDIRSSNYAKDVKLYKRAMLQCEVVLVATLFLGEKAKLFHPDVRLVRNGLSSGFVSVATNSMSNKKRNSGYITTAYLSGSSSHDRDFLLVEDTLLKLLREYPNLKILLAGQLRYSSEFQEFGDRFEYHEFMPYEEFQSLFSQIDINLVPLEIEQDFCQAKSELKYIEAGIFGVPSVVSPTKVHKQVITNDVNGRLVENNDWYSAIEELLNDEKLRISLGTAARKHVLQHYSAVSRTEDWLKLVTDIWSEYGEVRKAAPIKFETIFLRASLEISRWYRRARIYSRSLLPD